VPQDIGHLLEGATTWGDENTQFAQL
jgi:hypothetical protein